MSARQDQNPKLRIFGVSQLKGIFGKELPGYIEAPPAVDIFHLMDLDLAISLFRAKPVGSLYLLQLHLGKLPKGDELRLGDLCLGDGIDIYKVRFGG